MTDPDSETGAWLRRQRELRGWTTVGMARRLIDAGHDGDDNAVPGPDGMLRNVQRWESVGGVSDRYKLHYCRALGIDPGEFGEPDPKPRDPAPPPETAAPPVPGTPPETSMPDLAGPLLTPAAIMTYRGRHDPVPGFPTVAQEVVMAAAHESSDHAAEREPYGIGDITSEQLRADVMRLSREIVAGSSLSAFLELRRVRDSIHLLLDRRLLLREQGELYFLLSCVNGLMGITANRLGYPNAAEELLRAGWAYAGIIEHDPLRAMLRVKLAYINYLRGRYRESRDLAADGLRYVSQGSPGAELHVWHARAAAGLGDLDAARQSIALADAALDSDYSDDVMKIGGEFILTRATSHSVAGRALADVPGAERDAAAKLEEVIGLYDAGPGPGEEFWFAGKPLTGVSLALVRLRSGALDAAVAALGPTLALPAEQRISDITRPLALVRRELAAPVFQGSPQARDLNDQIETFDREAVTSGLHSLTG